MRVSLRPAGLTIAVLSFAAALNARTAGENLERVRDAIDAHAVTHHFEPPAKTGETKWQVAGIDGCSIELRESIHRELPDTVFTREGVFALSEDKVVTWTFNLVNLLPQFVAADTTGVPRLRIFADGDVFHLKTDFVSRTLNKDGTPQSTRNWSTAGSARNLWIYFDSPEADNAAVVTALESDLRNAVADCAGVRKAPVSGAP